MTAKSFSEIIKIKFILYIATTCAKFIKLIIWRNLAPKFTESEWLELA